MSWAHLEGANMFLADLEGADMSWADLEGTNMSGAHLEGADMGGAFINGTQFQDADLSLADLRNLKQTPLSKERFKEIKAVINQAFKSKVEKEVIISRLKRAMQRSDNLLTAFIHKPALCDNYGISKNCLKTKEISQYDLELADFLAELACANKYVANSMVIRFRLVGVPRDRELYHRVAESLLKPECEAGAELARISHLKKM